MVANPVYDESGLAGSWHFDEGSGTTAMDSSGNGNTGTLVNNPSWSDGKHGKAIGFDGVNDYADAGNIAAFNFPTSTTSFTLSAWFKTSGTGIGNVIAKGACGTPGYRLRIGKSGGAGVADFFIIDDGGNVIARVTSSSTYNDNAWHHLTGVNDNGLLRLYVDGTLIGTATAPSGKSISSSSSLAIGYDFSSGTTGCGSEYFNGTIDEVRIYSRALSSAEIQSLYEAKAKPNYDDIRFVDSDSSTQLNFWTESDGRFWVKIPSIPSGTKTIYVNYGNPSAASASNGDSTFDFFDDFEGTSLNTSKWNQNLLSYAGGTGSYSVSNGKLAFQSSNSGGVSLSSKNQLSGDKFRFEQKMLSLSSQGQTYSQYRTVLTDSTSSDPGANNGIFMSKFDNKIVFTVNSVSTSPAFTFDFSTPKRFLWHISENAKLFIDGSEKASLSNAAPALASKHVRLWVYYYATTDIDWLFVRKYATSEPSVSMGSEQPAANSPPEAAIILISPNPAAQGQAVNFTGSGTDTDGTIAAYEWAINGTAISSESSFIRADISPGYYTVLFRVRDNLGLWSAPTNATLSVGGNSPPIASIDRIFPSVANPNQTVSFSGSGYDFEGIIAAYEWTINGSIASNQSSFVRSDFSPGNYTVLFRVRDDSNSWSPYANSTLLVINNSPPVARISAEPQAASTVLAILFSAAGSYDPDNDSIVSYLWNFGDSITMITIQPTIYHTYAYPGTYTASVMAVDSLGLASANMDSIINVTISSPLVTSSGIISITPSFYSSLSGRWFTNITAFNVSWSANMSDLDAYEVQYRTYNVTIEKPAFPELKGNVSTVLLHDWERWLITRQASAIFGNLEAETVFDGRIYEFRARGISKKGMASSFSFPKGVAVDTGKPGCSIDVGPYTGTNVEVSWSLADGGSGVREGSLEYRNSTSQWSPAAPNSTTGGSVTIPYQGTKEDTLEFRCMATDYAGNKGDYGYASSKVMFLNSSYFRPLPAYINSSHVTSSGVRISFGSMGLGIICFNIKYNVSSGGLVAYDPALWPGLSSGGQTCLTDRKALFRLADGISHGKTYRLMLSATHTGGQEEWPNPGKSADKIRLLEFQADFIRPNLSIGLYNQNGTALSPGVIKGELRGIDIFSGAIDNTSGIMSNRIEAFVDDGGGERRVEKECPASGVMQWSNCSISLNLSLKGQAKAKIDVTDKAENSFSSGWMFFVRHPLANFAERAVQLNLGGKQQTKVLARNLKESNATIYLKLDGYRQAGFSRQRPTDGVEVSGDGSQATAALRLGEEKAVYVDIYSSEPGSYRLDLSAYSVLGDEDSDTMTVIISPPVGFSELTLEWLALIAAVCCVLYFSATHRRAEG